MMVAQHILDKEGTIMSYRRPEDTRFTRIALEVEERWCRTCGGALTTCDHRHHRVFTLNGPLHLVCKLAHCPTRACPAHPQTMSPEAETAITMPWGVLGWDVVCWLGQRRFARHWSVGQIRAELADTYQIRLSADAIETSMHRYQQMLAARHGDPRMRAAAYAQGDAVRLAIDGLQPEKGHATLYVVRELEWKRVWFAEALLSSATAEVQQLLAQARVWAERLGKPVRRWISDKQDAFVRGIAAEFLEVPHRYGTHHFLRDVAQPVLEADSHAKVKRRRTIRGLRAIERAVLVSSAPPSPPAPAPPRSARSRCPAKRRPFQRLRLRPRHVMSCWIIALPRGASSTTIKGGRCIPLVSVWRKPLVRCAHRSSGIRRRTKGGCA